jgi:hypothetical protein
VTDEQRPDAPDVPDSSETEAAEPDWVRRRRLAAVFGDVLPEATSDDRAEPGSEPAGDQQRSEEWLRRQVPPHHG